MTCIAANITHAALYFALYIDEIYLLLALLYILIIHLCIAYQLQME